MSIKYRPEIDGLRAIAVLSVIFFHAEFIFDKYPLLKGGYFGVDIFFVISGYLISLIIFREVDAGTFSFKSFYERRARRILPALFTVMLVSLPFAWVYMLPKALKEFAGSLLSSLAFGSNFWFWQEDSYWAEPSALKPLLHTWSLSVEEQFYVIFPIIIICMLKFFQRYILSLIFILFTASLIAAEYGASHFSSANFYLLPTRGWELLAGAAIARFEQLNGRPQLTAFNKFMPSIGLILILGSMLFIGEDIKHPSIITAVPICGTLLLILFCSKGEIITTLLSSKIIVAVGIVSYGFYLWHYPVFAFAKIMGSEHLSSDKFQWIIISLLLATVSYFAIEKPFRRKLKMKLFAPITGAVFLLLIGISTFFLKTNGGEFRLHEFEQKVSLNYFDKEKGFRDFFWTHKGCWWSKEDYQVNKKPFAECIKSENKTFKRPNILVIGDSNIASIMPGLIHHYNANAIIQRVTNGCLPAYPLNNDFCDAGTKAAINAAHEYKPDLIIIGGQFMEGNHFKLVLSMIENELNEYRDRIMIFGPLPRWGQWDVSKLLPNRLKDIFFSDDKAKLDTAFYLKPDEWTFELEKFGQYLFKHADIKYLSPVEAMCQKEKQTCLAKIGGGAEDITTFDYGHLTHKASIYMVGKMKQQIDEALFKKANYKLSK